MSGLLELVRKWAERILFKGSLDGFQPIPLLKTDADLKHAFLFAAIQRQIGAAEGARTRA